MINQIFEILFGKYSMSQDAKKRQSDYVFENYIGSNEDIIVLKIYYLGSFRADGKYLLKIKQVLQSKSYCKIYWLNNDFLWAEDELGLFPYGNRVHIYVIQYNINNKYMIQESTEKLRLVAELFDGGEVPSYSRKIQKNILLDEDNIPLSTLSFIPCKEQIYPY